MYCRLTIMMCVQLDLSAKHSKLAQFYYQYSPTLLKSRKQETRSHPGGFSDLKTSTVNNSRKWQFHRRPETS
ncbi:hypothetical protein AAMO2058_001334300 [Amorphochlora amoebiformis]